MGLAFLIAFNLRAVMLAVPPVLPLIRSDLHLSFTLAGGLTSLPILCLGVCAIPGALLSNRIGPRRLIGIAAIAIGLGALTRLFVPALLFLFLGTLILAVGIAVAQPAAAVIIREWFPGNVQRASTVYSLGLNTGGIAGTTLTVYLLVFDGWRGTFVIWAVPAILSAVIWLVLAPGRHVAQPEAPSLATLVRDVGVWRAAGLFGAQSIAYFTAGTWIPFLLRDYDPHYLSLVLFMMGIAILACGVVLANVRKVFALSPAFYVIAGVVLLSGAVGLSVGLKNLAWACAGLVGVGAGLTFTGAMSMPPMLAQSKHHVAGYAALMLTAGYILAFLGPLAGGVLVDQTGNVDAPFWLVIAAGILITGLGMTLPRRLSIPEDQRLLP